MIKDQMKRGTKFVGGTFDLEIIFELNNRFSMERAKPKRSGSAGVGTTGTTGGGGTLDLESNFEVGKRKGKEEF